MLIDKLLELDPGKRAVASVRFSHAHDVLADHFPGMPIVPGVLLTEAMGQTGGWLLASAFGFSRWPLLVMIERAKFRHFVAPDEELRLTADLRSARADTFEIDAEAHGSGRVVASARLAFHAFEFSLSDPNRDLFEAWARRVFRDIGGPLLLPNGAAPRGF